MIPQVIVLQPGLVIDKVYNGIWFFDRRTLEDLGNSAIAPLNKRAQKKQCDRDTRRNDRSTATRFWVWLRRRRDRFPSAMRIVLI